MAQNSATSEAPAGWRVEHDSMGEMLVPEDALWGAQTERSHENFPIGTERMPDEIVRAFAQLKAAAVGFGVGIIAAAAVANFLHWGIAAVNAMVVSAIFFFIGELTGANK